MSLFFLLKLSFAYRMKIFHSLHLIINLISYYLQQLCFLQNLLISYFHLLMMRFLIPFNWLSIPLKTFKIHKKEAKTVFILKTTIYLIVIRFTFNNLLVYDYRTNSYKEVRWINYNFLEVYNHIFHKLTATSSLKSVYLLEI